MRNVLTIMTQPKIIFRLAVIGAVLCGLWVMPSSSSARSQAISITVTNNSRWEIDDIYLSPVDSDNWGPDQLNGTVIHNGESTTLNISCDQSQIKVITEDKDGCFLYNTVSCSANADLTITNDATPDCGN